MNQIPSEILDTAVSGVGLMPGSLRDQLATTPTLLVFLRHFGCIFCRETVADLRRISEEDPSFPPVIFFFIGSATEGRAFLRRYWPGARAVADPDASFYAAFGVERGSWIKSLGPGVWTAKQRANQKGHANGDRTGDIWRMPGVFLVDGERIAWLHEFKHAGDLPDFAAVPRTTAQ